MLGNLIVDSTRCKLQLEEGLSKEEIQELKWQHSQNVQIEKIITHFRKADDKDLCIQTPVVENFKVKYQNFFDNFSVLGYLFHLINQYFYLLKKMIKSKKFNLISVFFDKYLLQIDNCILSSICLCDIILIM